MTNWFTRRTESDEIGQDMILAEALRGLDPANGDPNYWFRFRGSVMSRAARDLARRRLTAQLTVGDVLTSWARAVVPTAALAAALAALILMRSASGPAMQPIGVEELLVSELPSESVPSLLSTDASESFVAFAAEIF